MTNGEGISIKLNLDTGPTQRGLGETKQRTEQLKQSLASAAQTVQTLGAQGVQKLTEWRGALTKAGVAAAAMGASIAGALTAVKALGAQANLREGVINMGVTSAQIDQISKSLSGTVDRMTLLQGAKDALLNGADASQLEKMAKSAAFMAKEFVVTKEQALQMLSGMQLNDAMLKRLGTSAAEVQAEIAQAEARSTVAIGEQRRHKIALDVVMKAIQKKSGNFTKSTKQAGDGAARVLAEYKNATKELGKGLLPYLTKAVSLTNSVIKGAKMVGSGLAAGYRDLVNDLGNSAGHLYLRMVGAGDIAKANIDKLAKRARRQRALLDKNSKASLEQLAKQREKTIIDGMNKEALAEKRAAEARLARRKEIQAKLRQQYLEDLKQRQNQARDLLRNFNEKAIQSIADMGGSFGTVASGLTDVFEKFRILNSLPQLNKGVRVALDLAAEFAGKKQVDLSKEIDKRREALKLTDAQVKAAKLLANWTQGSAADTLELLANEKATNEQLKAGLSTLQSQAKIAQLRVEQANMFKHVQQFLAGIDRARSVYAAQRTALIKQGVKQTSNKVKLLGTMIQRLDRTKQQFETIATQRQRILATAMKHAKVEAGLEKTLQRIGRRGERQGVDNRIQSINADTNAMNATNPALSADARKKAIEASTQAARINAEIQQQIGQARLRQSELQARADAARAKAASALSEQQRQAHLADAKHFDVMISKNEQMINAIKRRGEAQKQSLTFGAQVMKQFMVTSEQFAARVASNLKSTLDGAIGGIANMATTFLSNLASADKFAGEKLGQTALEGLANLAIQWGSFFSMQGVGMMLGMNPAGAGVLAAGIGLTGLGIGLGVGASAIQTKPDTGSVGGRGGISRGSGPQFDRIPGTEPDQNKYTRVTNVYVQDTPWHKRSTQSFRELGDWIARNSRMTGRNPMAVAR